MIGPLVAPPLECTGRGCRATFAQLAIDTYLVPWETAAKQAGWRCGPPRADGTRPGLCPVCADAAERRFQAARDLAEVDDYLRVLARANLPVTRPDVDRKQAAERRWTELNGQSRNGRRAAA